MQKLLPTLLVILALVSSGCTSEQNTGEPQEKLLLISFDGFRYDYLSRTETPNFDSLITNGVKAEGLISIFPTKTFPAHYSIVTGLYPENSGLVGNTMYDPEWDEWYRISDRKAVEDGKWYEGEPIWNTAEKQGLTTGTMFWVGSEAEIQGMHPTYWKKYDGDMPGRARIDTVVSWLARDEKPADFATLYFELVDDAGHDYGLESDSLIAAIEKSDKLLGYLEEKLVDAGLWKSLNIIIVSDHGMVDLKADQTVLLDSIIDMDNVERIIWDPVTMIEPKQGKADQMYRKLKDAEQHNRYTVYRKEELPDRYHIRSHRRIPEIVVVADLGYTLMTEEYRERFLKGLPAATHGYDPKYREMQALFAASGPAFVSGDTVSAFQNIHFYELMAHVLDLNPAPNDGSLDSVKVLLR